MPDLPTCDHCGGLIDVPHDIDVQVNELHYHLGCAERLHSDLFYAIHEATHG